MGKRFELNEAQEVERLLPRVDKYFAYYHRGKNGEQVAKRNASKKNKANLARMIYQERVKAYNQGLHDAGLPPQPEPKKPWWRF